MLLRLEPEYRTSQVSNGKKSAHLWNHWFKSHDLNTGYRGWDYFCAISVLFLSNGLKTRPLSIKSENLMFAMSRYHSNSELISHSDDSSIWAPGIQMRTVNVLQSDYRNKIRMIYQYISSFNQNFIGCRQRLHLPFTKIKSIL